MGVLPEADEIIDKLIKKLPKLIDNVIEEILSGERLEEVHEKKLRSQIIKSVLEKIKFELDNKEKIAILKDHLKKALDQKWEFIKLNLIEKKDLKQKKSEKPPLKPTSKKGFVTSSDIFYLRCAVNKSKRFGLTLQNISPNNFTEVRIDLKLPPGVKASRKIFEYGKLLMGERKKKYLQFSPKKEGILNAKIVINSNEGYLATIPIELNIAQEDPGIEELMYKITRQINPKLYRPAPQVNLKLAEGIKSLSGELKKKKVFKIIIENNSLVDYSLVNIRLIAPPQIKVSKIPAYVGDLDRNKRKIRKFAIVPKKEGVFTIKAVATSSYGDLVTFPFNIHVGEEYITRKSEIELTEKYEIKGDKLKIKCPNCSIEIKKEDKFCSNCGYVLKMEEKVANIEKETKLCPFCGPKIPVQAKFCAQCGKNLE